MAHFDTSSAADDNFRCISLIENLFICIQISLKFGSSNSVSLNRTLTICPFPRSAPVNEVEAAVEPYIQEVDIKWVSVNSLRPSGAYMRQ